MFPHSAECGKAEHERKRHNGIYAKPAVDEVVAHARLLDSARCRSSENALPSPRPCRRSPPGSRCVMAVVGWRHAHASTFAASVAALGTPVRLLLDHVERSAFGGSRTWCFEVTRVSSHAAKESVGHSVVGARGDAVIPDDRPGAGGVAIVRVFPPLISWYEWSMEQGNARVGKHRGCGLMVSTASILGAH